MTGAILGNLRAVLWLAETEPRGGELGGVVMEDERGEDRTVPKGSKEEEVSRTVLMVMVDEDAIVEILQMGWACAVHACTSIQALEIGESGKYYLP